MRAIPEALAERLASGVTTLAHVWLITRRDGAKFAFTDHDCPLQFGDLVCEPALGLRMGVIDKSLGLGVDTASFAGALSSDALHDSDLARGLWDGARVDVFRVDWTDPSLNVHEFAGRIGEISRGESAFEAELRGLQAPLNKPVGRVFSRYCDADLGDARCGKSLAATSFRGVGAVVAVLGPAALRASGLETFAEGWFSRGKLVWDAGGESEVASHFLDGGAAVIELREAPGAMPEPGAGFVVFAGCDKRYETCGAKFANTPNFRGFPHMPGNDVVQARPIAGQVLDGGSRFR